MLNMLLKTLIQNVFMGVAIDTYDEEGGIHPRNKQLVSGRLAVAGLNVAYGMTDYPTNGPFPEVWNFAKVAEAVQVIFCMTKILNGILLNLRDSIVAV